MTLSWWSDRLTRRKRFTSTAAVGRSSLARVLTVGDLVGLAVGSTLGLGIYVLAGDVAKNAAGPAVVLSFLVAAIASLFAALCYAEFAARVPRAGSAYVYSYVSIGEFVAFVIGWNLILEYLIGTASVARGYSIYMDSVLDGRMRRLFQSCCPIHVSVLSPYPDFFAFSLVLALSVLLAVGVKESVRFNNVFTLCNLAVCVFVVVCGLFKADLRNWQIDPATVDNPNGSLLLGSGGFFPFGFSGMMAGAARCFFGFVGFDCVATTGEEAKDPQRSIPLAIMIGLAIIFFSYFGVSAVLTLMWPYYLQDDRAPLPMVFHALNWELARWIVTVGALFGLSSSLLGALFPLPRILYAMANDGLIFRQLGSTHARFHTPFLATILSGLMAALMAALFDLHQLVDMMSIGTLLAYTLVATCVLVLRYRDESFGVVQSATCSADGSGSGHNVAAVQPVVSPRTSSYSIIASTGLVSLLFNTVGAETPHRGSILVVNAITMLYGVVCVCFCGVLISSSDRLARLDSVALFFAVLLGFVLLVCCVSVYCQPQSKVQLHFKVPLVPFLPMLSIFINVYLMLKLGSATWIRFTVWMAIGLCVYFGYGVWNACEPVGSATEFIDLDYSVSSEASDSPPGSPNTERTALVKPD